MQTQTKSFAAALWRAAAVLALALSPFGCGGGSGPLSDASAQGDAPGEVVVADAGFDDADLALLDGEIAPLDSEVDLPGLNPCTADPFEPNDEGSTAPPLPGGSSAWLTLCAPEEDWFSVTLSRGERIRVTLQFDPALGYLSVELLDPAGDRLAVAHPVLSGARFELSAPANGSYSIRVHAPLGAPNRYRIVTERVVDPCPEDPEPRGTPSDALTLTDSQPLDGTVCGLSPDWFRFVPSTGNESFLTIDIGSGGGEVTLDLFSALDSNGAALSTRVLRPGRQIVSLPPRDEGYFVRFSGSQETRASYRLSLRTSKPGLLAVRRYDGVVRYADRPLTPSGYGPTVYEPLPFVRLQLVWAEQPVWSGSTDGDGAFRAEVLLGLQNEVSIRVIASTQSAGLTVALRPTVGGPVSVVERPLPIDPGSTPLEIDLAVLEGAPIFNILDLARRSLALIAPLGLSATYDALDLIYEEGTVNPCITCYNTGRVYISGSLDDPDAYDDAVIAHEVWHFIEDAYSRRDTPGGFHDGTRTDPALAFSEGFAHFFQAVVRGESNYLDFRNGTVRRFVLDPVLDPESFGTSDGSVTGSISENLVDAALFGLYSGSAARLPIPYEMLLWPPTLAFRRSEFVDRGWSGVDWLDYLDALRCLKMGLDPLIQSVVVDERKFPYDFAGPEQCLDP
ncbi:MAG: hypothetical protein KC609_22510 [Myxococcales bacterium]|nr:hypothetical protein [Myxococcales bacterium]